MGGPGMDRAVLLLTVFCGVLPPVAAANDLLAAYQEAKVRDAVLAVATFQRSGAEEVLPAARAAFLPQVTSVANAAREKEAYASSLSGPYNSAQNGSDTTTGYVSTYGITVSQTLWDLEGFRRIKEAGMQVAQAQATYRGVEQALILRIAQAYFGILSAADRVATAESQRKAFGELLRQAQVREQQGLSARTDVAEAQSFYDSTDQSVIDAEDVLEDAKRGLTEITGRYPQEVAPLEEDIPLAAPTPSSADEWAELARQDNPDVIVASLGVEAAQRDMQVQRAKYWPTLALQGSASHTQEPLALGGNESVNGIALQLNWPIYQGGAIQSQVRQATATYEQARAQLDIVQRHADREARLAFRGVASGVARVQAARRAVESGRNAVEASRLSVEFGARNEFDLLNQQNDYYSAVRAYKQSRYDYLTAMLQLKFQAGNLHETDLARVDDLLVQASAAGTP